jgi:hypothetical protein
MDAHKMLKIKNMCQGSDYLLAAALLGKVLWALLLAK